MTPDNDRKSVSIYLLFTLALSSVFYYLIAKSGHSGGGWGGPATRSFDTSSPWRTHS